MSTLVSLGTIPQKRTFPYSIAQDKLLIILTGFTTRGEVNTGKAVTQSAVSLAFNTIQPLDIKT